MNRIFGCRGIFLPALILVASFAHAQVDDQRPNVLFFFADDWGRYASIYADEDNPSLNDVISTPSIDRIGREGVVFEKEIGRASCRERV